MFEKFLEVTLVLLLIVCVFLFFFLIYLFVDTCSLADNKTTGVVTEKVFVKSHSTTVLTPCGKVMIPITTFHPDAYDITVKIGGGETINGNIEANDFLHGLKINDRVNVVYKVGRISNAKILTTIKE